jgi:hypothetical protein
LGFSSYKEVDFWLKVVQGIPSNYGTIYNLVKTELKSKLKVARPRNISQKQTAINDFKNSLSERIKVSIQVGGVDKEKRECRVRK